MRDGYNGNPLIKGSNRTHNYTAEQIVEYKKCMEDPVYFCETYVKIVNVDKGLINFDLYDYQKKIIKTVFDNRFSIFKLPRQCGKTTSIGSGCVLHFVLFNLDKKVAILANKGDMAKKILGDIKKSFEYLPKWLQQGVVEWNKTSVTFENGSKIIVAATTADAARGDSYAMIVLDEFAFIPENEADEFFSSVFPTISSGETTKMVVVSTPNGINQFYKMWTEAIEGRSGFVPLEINWWETPGRDDTWKQMMIKGFGGGSDGARRFAQEFACEFHGSVNTLLSGPCLASLAHKTPIATTNEGLDIYEYPEKDHSYITVVDVASGNGGDYSAFVVINISVFPYRISCKYRSNELSPIIFPDVIYRTVTKYNNSWTLIELNQDGGQVANDLHDDYEYENLIYIVPSGRKGQVASLEGFGKKIQLGVKTSAATKRIGCSMLKSLVEDHKLVVEDFETISEFYTFVSKRKSFEADIGKNDDLVMTLVLFGWLTAQPVFNELKSDNIKMQLLDQRLQKQEELMTPLGFYYNGSTDQEEDVKIKDSDNQFWERDDGIDPLYGWGLMP